MSTVQSLIAQGATVNLKDRDGLTALTHAAITSSGEALRVLADAGADLNAADNRGSTALIYSALDALTIDNNVEIPRLSLRRGVGCDHRLLTRYWFKARLTQFHLVGLSISVGGYRGGCISANCTLRFQHRINLVCDCCNDATDSRACHVALNAWINTARIAEGHWSSRFATRGRIPPGSLACSHWQSVTDLSFMVLRAN